MDSGGVEEMQQSWLAARKLFEVEVPQEEAARRIADYAARYGLSDPGVPDAVRFDAVSLNQDGTPVRVMHSDTGYALLFQKPDVAVLESLLELVTRSFPAGLCSDVGMPIANPAFATEEQASGLGPGDYHGAVMWPWQHAMWIIGLREQAERAEVPADLRSEMRRIADSMHETTSGIEDLRTAELWSWKSEDGQLRAVPFGQDSGHHAESNAAQLWSAVALVLGR
jgi:hypothetical protein